MRGAGLISMVAGAAGSVVFTIYAGRHNMHTPAFLLLLFALWVSSPFVAVAFAYRVSERWSTRTRTTLYSLTVILAVASLAIYAAVSLSMAKPKTAIFVLVPPASWLAIAVVLPTVARKSRRQ